MTYELIVIGGGPAGYLAAERAGEAGLSTLLIEKRFLGGVCLNEGCIPSKALLYSAKIADNARQGEKYGVEAADVVLNHSVVIKRKNKVVRNLVAGVKGKMRKNKVTVVDGAAYIAGRHAEGYEVKVGEDSHVGRRLLIATGSIPIMPPIHGVKEGAESGFVLTNREILDLEEVPNRLAIVGGGVIGLEMASYYQSAGSQVTIIEMLDHIAGPTDSEISQILQKNYEKKGINFLLGSKVTKIEDNAVVYESDGQTHKVDADKVLMSIGRRAATEGLGLENIGVELERGRIKVDNICQT
ncbi:MAG: FAD-dependent oxidoreductase, partial [Clostridiales bacterium]|nr:FAD-dependent oxidoreductase [Clostridiales bacterium]